MIMEVLAELSISDVENDLISIVVDTKEDFSHRLRAARSLGEFGTAAAEDPLEYAMLKSWDPNAPVPEIRIVDEYLAGLATGHEAEALDRSKAVLIAQTFRDALTKLRARIKESGDLLGSAETHPSDALFVSATMPSAKQIKPTSDSLDAEAIRALISGGEGELVEFKKSFSEHNEAIISLCAFAHAKGGRVLFGVTDDKKIHGVTLGRNTLEAFANNVRVNTQPPLTVSIREVPDVEGQLIVVVSIEAALGDQLFQAFGKSYIRSGRTNQVMSPEDMRARLRRKPFP